MTTELVSQLQTENARLIALLEQHGIEWRLPAKVELAAVVLTTDQKVALFRRFFRGRDDVFPVRWYSKTTGKSGYSPVCSNEWKSGVCRKPQIKCGDCEHRLYTSLSDEVVYKHLCGVHVIGVYPLLEDNCCHFLAVDFDDESWRADAVAFVKTCQQFNVSAALEISSSGAGAHVWIFFSKAVLARDARRLGAALISATCANLHQLQLKSYDRLFPNQDTMPKGGLGNLIALPLQKLARDQGFSVFVDLQLQPYADQWGYLASIVPMPAEQLDATIFQLCGDRHPLDVSFIEAEDLATPWQRNATPALTGELPKTINIVLSNQIYFDKRQLPQSLANRLIRLASFQNPEFYKAQAMRMSVWDTPRVICCAENFPQHIALPRGCLGAASQLLQTHHIAIKIQDERHVGASIDVQFNGLLRPDQEQALNSLMQYETGVLSAPTAFGKTVTAAALIARQGINTLILVHRTELLKQWQQRLTTFLNNAQGQIGCIGDGKFKMTGKIDIAVMQSLLAKEEQIIENYGQIIVDECHHISSVSFEKLLKQAKAKYVYGLTATPIRRDGQQPIIFMQCGPIRVQAQTPSNAPEALAVHRLQYQASQKIADDSPIQDIYRELVQDSARTQAIVAAIQAAYQQRRKILVLTERTEHLECIQQALPKQIDNCFVLHGRIGKKARNATLATLDNLPADTPRIILATGKLIGEGFDHPPLDTLVLAMPIAWKGTLQQYAGRLHREHANKQQVQVIDVVDTAYPVLLRMWDKRVRGYRMMEYRIDV